MTNRQRRRWRRSKNRYLRHLRWMRNVLRRHDDLALLCPLPASASLCRRRYLRRYRRAQIVSRLTGDAPPLAYRLMKSYDILFKRRTA